MRHKSARSQDARQGLAVYGIIADNSILIYDYAVAIGIISYVRIDGLLACMAVWDIEPMGLQLPLSMN